MVQLSKLLGAYQIDYLHGGKGSRSENNKMMASMTWKGMKKHVALQPLFAIMGMGILLVAGYTIRLATLTTDINWRKSKDPGAPMEYYRTKQFKFLNPLGIDYEREGKSLPPRPVLD